MRALRTMETSPGALQLVPWVETPPEGRINLPLTSPELYDVMNDPEEAYKCSSAHPDVVKDITRRVMSMLPTFPNRVQAESGR